MFSLLCHYQHRLECHADSFLLNVFLHLQPQYTEHIFDETLYNFLGDFFLLAIRSMRHDGFTAIPCASFLHKFLTSPCSKSIGIVQCKIKCVYCTSKGKRRSFQGGIKGRICPSYKYRLFIQDQRNLNNSSKGHENDDNSSQHDMMLMTVWNRGKSIKTCITFY